MPTTVVRIRPGQLGAVIEGTARQVPVVAQRAITSGAQRAVGHLKKITPVDTGRAKNAWQANQEPRGVSVTNDAPYAGILERGARPHPVSAEGWMAIFRWVLRHPHLFAGATKTAVGLARRAVNGSGQGKKQRKKTTAAVAEATEITNAIVWKLKNKGQAPLWLVRDSLPQFKKWLAEEINRMMVDYIRRTGKAGK